ncbi:hypothetical protein BC567DRAFT_213757 [Phyllosticta citribraziliensis]
MCSPRSCGLARGTFCTWLLLGSLSKSACRPPGRTCRSCWDILLPCDPICRKSCSVPDRLYLLRRNTGVEAPVLAERDKPRSYVDIL